MRKRPVRASLVAVAVVVFSTTLGLAQSPGLSGTWKLDASRSEGVEDAIITGLIAAGAPETLHVTQPANGTLVVESQVNESHARLYVPGKETSTPVFLGEPGSITMSARWEGGRLVSTGVREVSSGASTSVRESYGLSEDGRTLEVETVISDGDSELKSSLKYSRIQDVGSCESWPSPCKEFTPR